MGEIRPMKQKEKGNSYQAAQREGDLWWALQGSGEDLLYLLLLPFLFVLGPLISGIYNSFAVFLTVFKKKKKSRLDSKVKQ